VFVKFHSGYRVSFPEVRRPGRGDDKVVASFHIERNSLNINQAKIACKMKHDVGVVLYIIHNLLPFTLLLNNT